MSKDSISSYEAMATGSPGLLARAYFRIKPFIPPRVRLALRRGRARRIARRCQEIWPINEEAGSAPDGWQGWPEAMDFAVVFTHDVESSRGLERVKELAELEMTYGLRSSFNLIPEGPYADPSNLRRWLERNAFEVGVHDLNHDGLLYGSEQGFREKATKINRYLSEWGAVGFRSAFMLRNLDWIHELDVIYDASSFDTDPFEPQPEGSQTIFPFEVRSGEGRPGPGYIELSYTLPQDSTLFLLLGEETVDIWKRKLDWIAGKGGLALVNIHPDYIDFPGESSSNCYPSALIREFCGYLCTRYKGRFWNPLARELAVWYRAKARLKSEVADPAC